MNDQTENPYSHPMEADKKPTKKAWIRLMQVFVVLAIILVVVGLLLPASRRSGGREAMRRMFCQSNLRQLGIAILNYQAVYKALPPACTTDAEGKPLHSWRVLILPYIEQNALYQKIDLSRAWDDAANADARANMPEIFRCPAVNLAPGHTTYLAVVGDHLSLLATSSRKIEQVIDGLRNTVMLYEANASQSVHWMSPMDANQDLILSEITKEHAPHHSVRTVTCMDGTTNALPATFPPETLKALLTIDGREKIEDWEER